MLPRRIYAGHAKGRVQYFPLRMPVAMGPEAALFVYIDPGMETRTELDSWREAHRPLWQMLRELGWRNFTSKIGVCSCKEGVYSKSTCPVYGNSCLGIDFQ